MVLPVSQCLPSVVEPFVEQMESQVWAEGTGAVACSLGRLGFDIELVLAAVAARLHEVQQTVEAVVLGFPRMAELGGMVLKELVNMV